MTHLASVRACALLAALLTSTLSGADAAASSEPFDDRLTVKGDTLRGRVVRLTTEVVEFRTVYGEGDLRIRYEDVEALETAGEYHVVRSDGVETIGRIVGVEDGEILVGETPETAEKVATQNIRGVASEEEFEESYLTRLRARFPHWSAEFDLAFDFEQGAVDKDKVRSRLRFERRLKPTRFIADIEYALDIQQKRDGPEITTKDEFFSGLRFDHDLPVDKFFATGAVGYEFDTPRRIENRVFPTAGVGYRLFEREDTSFLAILGGFGWVYEDFDGFPDNDYAAALLGLEAEWLFPRDIRLRSVAMYMPSLTDISNDWLFRWELDLTVPIWDPIAMRFRMRNVNDDNPTPDVGNNKFTTILGFSLNF